MFSNILKGLKDSTNTHALKVGLNLRSLLFVSAEQIQVINVSVLQLTFASTQMTWFSDDLNLQCISCQNQYFTARHKVRRLTLADCSWTGARLPVETSGDPDQQAANLKRLQSGSTKETRAARFSSRPSYKGNLQRCCQQIVWNVILIALHPQALNVKLFVM